MRKLTPAPQVQTSKPQLIAREFIAKNPLNPRVYFREEELDSLKDSIARLGIMVPLIVFPDPQKPKHYVLLDGERRLRCATELGLQKVPTNVIAAPTTAENMLRMFNIHSLREQWDPYTIAVALDKLMQELRTRNTKELAVLTGFTVGSINRSKKLLRLPAKYLEMLQEELGKPKSDQILTEDFFLEAGDAVSAIQRFHPEVYDQHGQNELIDRLVSRRKAGKVKSIVDLRMITDIANYKRSRITKARSEGLIKRIVDDENADLRELFTKSVEPSLAAKQLLPLLKKLRTELDVLDPESLTETSRGELIQELAAVQNAVTTTLKRMQEL